VFVVLRRIEGASGVADTVILGAHQDSVNSRGGSPSTNRSPGADDDGISFQDFQAALSHLREVQKSHAQGVCLTECAARATVSGSILTILRGLLPLSIFHPLHCCECANSDESLTLDIGW
jgi:hypothetical protein